MTHRTDANRNVCIASIIIRIEQRRSRLATLLFICCWLGVFNDCGYPFLARARSNPMKFLVVATKQDDKKDGVDRQRNRLLVKVEWLHSFHHSPSKHTLFASRTQVHRQYWNTEVFVVCCSQHTRILFLIVKTMVIRAHRNKKKLHVDWHRAHSTLREREDIELTMIETHKISTWWWKSTTGTRNRKLVTSFWQYCC